MRIAMKIAFLLSVCLVCVGAFSFVFSVVAGSFWLRISIGLICVMAGIAFGAMALEELKKDGEDDG